jgi:hypothetical protein
MTKGPATVIVGFSETLKVGRNLRDKKYFANISVSGGYMGFPLVEEDSLEEIARRLCWTTIEYKPVKITSLEESLVVRENSVSRYRPLTSDEMSTLYDHLYRRMR